MTAKIIFHKSITILNIGCIKKRKPLFVKDFLGNNKTEFIEGLHTITLEYYQHFYKVFKRSVTNYVSNVKLKIMLQLWQRGKAF